MMATKKNVIGKTITTKKVRPEPVISEESARICNYAFEQIEAFINDESDMSLRDKTKSLFRMMATTDQLQAMTGKNTKWSEIRRSIRIDHDGNLMKASWDILVYNTEKLRPEYFLTAFITSSYSAKDHCHSVY